MHDWSSLSHVRWDCKYHIVFVSNWIFRPKPMNLLQPADIMALSVISCVRPTCYHYFTALNHIKMSILVILCLTCKTLPYIVAAWLTSTSKRKKEDPTCTFEK